MSFSLGLRSRMRLLGVHAALSDVVYRAIKISSIDFTVVEGRRSFQRQAELYRRGASQTMNSRHLTGHAVDIAPWVNGGVSWHWSDFDPIARAMKAAAYELSVFVEWGGDWAEFRDGAHWQLDWVKHPPDGIKT